MSEINVYVTTKKVKQNATDLLDKVKVLQRDMDEYIGMINKLENTLQQQAKEIEEKRKVEELKAAEKKRQARKAEKGEKADAAPTAIPAEPPADKPAKKQFVRNDTRKKTFRQSNKIIDEFLAQPPVFSQKEKKADGTKEKRIPELTRRRQRAKNERAKGLLGG